MTHLNALQPSVVISNKEGWHRLQRLKLLTGSHPSPPMFACADNCAGVYIIQCCMQNKHALASCCEVGISSRMHGCINTSSIKLSHPSRVPPIMGPAVSSPCGQVQQEPPRSSLDRVCVSIQNEASLPMCISATSGSAGQPKYVSISHSSILHRVRWQQTTFPLSGDDLVMIKTSPAFVDSLWELISPMIFGEPP